jgi:hypothetical protein
LALSSIPYGVLGHLLFAFPSGRVEHPVDRFVVAVAYLLTTVHDLLAGAQSVVGLMATGALIWHFVRRARNADPNERLCDAPVWWVGAATMVLFGALLLTLDALATRSSVPVTVNAETAGRAPAAIEAAAYFVVVWLTACQRWADRSRSKAQPAWALSCGRSYRSARNRPAGRPASKEGRCRADLVGTMRAIRSAIPVALVALALTPAAAGAATFGADLSVAPNVNFDCEVTPPVAGFQVPSGADTCTWWTTGRLSETSQGHVVPYGGGTITQARVRVGPVTGPMQFVVMRSLRHPQSLRAASPSAPARSSRRHRTASPRSR